ncbi:MAG TPA: permease [Syntrophales bacterium]|nr:permease [Syntrophales bacterium]HOL58314.1 permease [Syntrophales bacterium]HPO34483.1 permease [Syntrophales bacterium]
MLFFKELFWAGLWALKDYVATHVLTCLVPAFLLAGAMVAFINQESILTLLGEKARKLKSFSIASVASFFVAACSCTVIPVAAGLYFSGAAIGVAFIVLWVAPSANILSLIYTGNILGASMVISRVIASIAMAFVVGWVMTLAFPQEREMAEQEVSRNKILTRKHLIFLLLIVISLLLPNYIGQKGPYLEKVIVWGLATIVLILYALKALTKEEIKSWLRESWWFVKIILPLLLGGVFLVGVIGKLLPEAWIRSWLGGNGVFASFLATMIGAVSYFATMTEAPFVDTLMKLGMGKGPALALLLTGPGLSLPNWIAIARVFGWKKSFVYVVTIVILGTIVGWFFGNFIF